jgi:hypothetical protein
MFCFRSNSRAAIRLRGPSCKGIAGPGGLADRLDHYPYNFRVRTAAGCGWQRRVHAQAADLMADEPTEIWTA